MGVVPRSVDVKIVRSGHGAVAGDSVQRVRAGDLALGEHVYGLEEFRGTA